MKSDKDKPSKPEEMALIYAAALLIEIQVDNNYKEVHCGRDETIERALQHTYLNKQFTENLEKDILEKQHLLGYINTMKLMGIWISGVTPTDIEEVLKAQQRAKAKEEDEEASTMTVEQETETRKKTGAYCK